MQDRDNAPALKRDKPDIPLKTCTRRNGRKQIQGKSKEAERIERSKQVIYVGRLPFGFEELIDLSDNPAKQSAV